VRLGARRSRQGERGAKPGRGGQSGSGRRGGQPGQNGLCQFTAGRPASGRGRCEALRLPERRVVCLPHELHPGRRLLPDGQRPQLTLIERWNGTAWQVEPSPSIGRGSTLDSVSCPSATSCTAVGSLILGWNGASWKVEFASSPFVTVSCAAPSSCMAVGVTAGGQPESGYFNGTSWTLEPMPRPPHPGAKHHPGRSLLRRAGLVPGGRGLLLRRGRHAQPHGQGQDPRRTVERIVLAGHPNGQRGELEPADRGLVHITARVHRVRQQRVGKVRARRALGRRGVADPARARREPDRPRPAAVSCSSDSACMAVGTCNAGITAIAESWNGAAWTLHPMPGPPAGLSCTGARRMRRGRKRRPHARRDLGRHALADHAHPQSVIRARQPGRADVTTQDSWRIPDAILTWCRRPPRVPKLRRTLAAAKDARRRRRVLLRARAVTSASPRPSPRRAGRHYS
jgi:hypothetical protein